MSTNDSKESVLKLLDIKESNQLICYDFRVSLFVCALNSYRCNSILKPFPNLFINSFNNEKQFDFVKTLINEIPVLTQLNSEFKMSENSWKLIDWIMSFGSFRLNVKSFNSDEIKNILTAEQLSVKNYKPSIIFEVVSQPKKAFLSAKQEFGSFTAFHGSKVENFHSILHNGLINCLNQRDLYGSGTYLSAHISVAIEFSPFGFGFSKSLLGREISCVAVCEVVNHPSIKRNKSTNDLPNAYYVVQNDDFIHVSHILVYCKKQNQNSVSHNAISSTIYNHRPSLVIISLIFILIALGLKYS